MMQTAISLGEVCLTQKNDEIVEMNLPVDEVVHCLRAGVRQRGKAAELRKISIDSRTIKPGDWFLAIKGPFFDGHDFVRDIASQSTVPGVIVADPEAVPTQYEGWVLVVKDTIYALGSLAAAWRNRCVDTKVVALTGSNGKSTTKEMVASIVSTIGPTVKTEGNFNNLIGVPLTLLRFCLQHRFAVVEMGMSAAGEIARLTEIVAPDVGLITNITAAHLETLRSIENVMAAKGELFAGMDPEGTIIVNAEDPWVMRLADEYAGKKIRFGMGEACEVRFGHMSECDLQRMELAVYLQGREWQLSLPVVGTHNVMNAMCAMAVGLALEIEPEKIIKGLAGFVPMKMRMERVQLSNGVQVINDSYNANPESMRAALRTVAAAKRAGKLIAVLGDMLELGDAARASHEQLGRQAVMNGVDMLFAVGEFSTEVAAGALAGGLPRNVVFEDYDDVQGIAVKVGDLVSPGDIVLVKGSRGMQMERVVEHLKRVCGVD